MEYLEILDKNGLPTEAASRALSKKVDFKIDKDYLEFIKNHDGAEGFLSYDCYLSLWSIEDLLSLNPYYENEPKCKDYFFFGSDGSNLGYAFNKEDGDIIAIDFLDIGDKEPKHIANSFKLFIEKLSS